MFGFIPPAVRQRARRRLGDDYYEGVKTKPSSFVWRPFGGRMYSYPDFEHGNAMSMMGFYTFVALTAGAFSFSVVEALVILALALFDAEAPFYTPEILPYHKTNPTWCGISGINGWLAGHNLSQLFFKDRRNYFCLGGLTILFEFTRMWLMGTERIAHDLHFQTLGAGVLSALAMRYGLKRKDPVRYLRGNSAFFAFVSIAGGFYLWYTLKNSDEDEPHESLAVQLGLEKMFHEEI